MKGYFPFVRLKRCYVGESGEVEARTRSFCLAGQLPREMAGS